MAGFLGMRGNGDWATDQRPLNWREMILHEFPNGMAPLTAMLSMMPSETVDDPQFHWWTKSLASQGGAVTDVYNNSAMTTSYTSGGVAGDIQYVSVLLAVAKEFRAGHVVLLRDASDLTVDLVAKVESVTLAGAVSKIAVTLLEADNNSSSNDMSEVDTILIIGNMNAEGALIPDAISYDPTKHTNYTQIFRTALNITDTARNTHLRTGDGYKELKRECLELHSIEMEKAFLWGIKTENTVGSQPERTTQGLIPGIKANASANVFTYTSDSSFSGQTWIQGGETWIDESLEVIFRRGKPEKMAFVGSGAMLGISRLAKTYGSIQLTPKTTDYGIAITTWITPFGVIHLKTHPLFSHEATNRNQMVVFEPSLLKYRYVQNRDTHFVSDKRRRENTNNGRDGTNEEFKTEAGLEQHHFAAAGILQGLNTLNTA